MKLQCQQDPLELEDVPDDYWKDLGMVPSPPITIGSMRFLSSATLDLDNIQFSSVGKFQSGGLLELQSQQFGLSGWFYQ